MGNGKIAIVLFVIACIVIAGIVFYSPQEPVQDETYCEQDIDCACGRNIDTGACFRGNKDFVDTTNPCPDFCSGFTGDLVTKCVENTCTAVVCPEVMCEMFCKDGFVTDDSGCEICECK